MSNNNRKSKLKVAVIAGNHPFDVISFYDMFFKFNKIKSYIQNLEDFVFDVNNDKKKYDVIVFYNFHMSDNPATYQQDWLNKSFKTGIDKFFKDIGETKCGIVILHHSLLAFPKSEIWSNICGIKNRSFDFHLKQKVSVKVSKKDHPIIRNIKDWSMVDEIYTMDNASANENKILLTTDHPLSMNTLAWTRNYKKARVFCFVLGHNNTAYENPNFKKVLIHGIEYVSGRIC